MNRLTKTVFLALLLAACLPLTTACSNRCAHCGETIKVDTLEGVLFDFNKATIKPEGQKILDKDVDLMKKDKTLNVTVEGYCDYIGNDAYNQKLSERRANSVVDYLASKGIPREHMKAVGYGRTKPIAPNTTEAGRAKNRRVELHIIKARAH